MAAVQDVLPVGVVARYRTNRDFYAAVFDIRPELHRLRVCSMQKGETLCLDVKDASTYLW